MTDTELYEIVKDVPHELWPEKLEHNDYDGWHRAVYAHNPTAKIGAEPLTDAHALLLWEGALSRVLSDLGGRESRDVPRGRWLAFTSGVSAPHADEIRLKALVAAVKELSK